jgi:hypothetical protein
MNSLKSLNCPYEMIHSSPVFFEHLHSKHEDPILCGVGRVFLVLVYLVYVGKEHCNAVYTLCSFSKVSFWNFQVQRKTGLKSRNCHLRPCILNAATNAWMSVYPLHCRNYWKWVTTCIHGCSCRGSGPLSPLTHICYCSQTVSHFIMTPWLMEDMIYVYV